MTQKQKIAVVLFNLGGPDSRGAIYPFLVNFFMDPAIIRAPWPVRFLLSRYIAFKRSRGAARTAYAKLGFRSPLLSHTEDQARALQTALNNENSTSSYTVHVSMRYWHPRAAEVVKTITDQHPDRIIGVPLYPQFSTTTSGSSWDEFQSELARAGLSAIPTQFLCCYPTDPGFVAASADNIRRVYEKLRAETTRPPRLLFSAHGLPKKIIAAGDPYQRHCEDSARAIVDGLAIPKLDWQICYQSRVGPLEWIGPSTDAAIEKAGADQVPVVIYPHAFVSEHVETLVEIEEEYRHLANLRGVPGFARAPTVMTHPAFIQGLAQQIKNVQDRSGTVLCGAVPCPCGAEQTACPRKTAILKG